MESKKNNTNEHIQNRNRVTDVENKLMVGEAGRMNKEYGINRYKLLYMKQISNKDLLYST